MDIMGKQRIYKRYYKSIHCCLKFCCFWLCTYSGKNNYHYIYESNYLIFFLLFLVKFIQYFPIHWIYNIAVSTVLLIVITSVITFHCKINIVTFTISIVVLQAIGMVTAMICISTKVCIYYFLPAIYVLMKNRNSSGSYSS